MARTLLRQPLLYMRPISAASFFLSVVGAGSNFGAVDEEASDGDTSYVYNDTETTKADSYNFSSANISPLAIIESVRIYSFLKKTGGPSANVRLIPIINSSVISVSLGATNNNFTAAVYTAVERTYTTHPTANRVWIPDDFNGIGSFDLTGIQLAMEFNSPPSAEQIRCTQVFVEITYSFLGAHRKIVLS